ncbi:MAG: cupin domain-containing protein [Alphaproteobacteria bacterium]|nr:cupin domain-containing protein [Alphaproteobacteria bacterium]
MPTDLDVETFVFGDDGVVPNNTLPLVLYRGALPESSDRAGDCERLFAANGWPGAWRNGIYGHHHYHSTAHEVLGIARGHARITLGGEQGQTLELRAGDIVVVPAGVAHKRESSSNDLVVIGSYPRGQKPDICAADARRHATSAARVGSVPLPDADPVSGQAGPLLDCWKRGAL